MAETAPKRRRTDSPDGAKPVRTRRAKPAPPEEFRPGGAVVPAGELGELRAEEISVRAYHISLSPERGSDEENWLRAERELLAERSPQRP